MSTVIDVSSKLGEYMLKGWVLTDRICKKCSKVPLMRSPADSAVYWCANCDDNAGQAASVTSHSASSSLDSGSHISRASTPLTEVSSALSSPTFTPIDTEEILRRRQQSDLASTEIGKRLLKGWAMLADECPNLTCYGVPLVRPPKAGGERDPRKECVVCNTVYVDEADANGFERLVPLASTPAVAATSRTPITASPAPIAQRPMTSSAKGKAIERSQAFHAPVPARMPSTSETVIQAPSSKPQGYDPSLEQDIATSADSLQQSLRALSERLKTVSSPYGMDVALIGQTADAMSKVAQALLQLQQLQHSYR
ncbi:hypothetical protein PsYK624_007830 [Phanerochaete sordida]|uniref:Uncharacterized protein n=1 Tax=Phanerochaete sordida TaxID=48140 RepID=A0A9P3FY95_9APHY|nr:hypothetical protein PsYK624_007830 [Phanerochaete sordida]